MRKFLTTVVGGSAVAATWLSAAPIASAQVAAPAQVAHAQVAAIASKPPVVYSQPNWAGPQVRPMHFYDITGDSSEWLNTPSWKHWNGISAYSVGKYAYRSCFGKCDKFKTVTADITVWRVRAHGNTLYYTRLKWVYVLKHHKHVVIAWFSPHSRAVLWIRHP
jgi:hypothetical protein